MLNDCVCPICGHNNRQALTSTAWNKIGYMPVLCSVCDGLFWAKLQSGKNSSTEVILVNRVPVFKILLPDIPEEAVVYIINKQHPKHMEPGVVTKRAHCYYRVKFNDESVLWVPSHLVERCPF